MPMKSLKPLLLSALIALSGAAFAAGSDYTDAVKKIDAAMTSGKFTASTTDEVRKLRADGEKMMKAGKEAEAMKILEKAKKLLDIK
jgi:hypothetical protein